MRPILIAPHSDSTPASTLGPQIAQVRSVCLFVAQLYFQQLWFLIQVSHLTWKALKSRSTSGKPEELWNFVIFHKKLGKMVWNLEKKVDLRYFGSKLLK